MVSEASVQRQTEHTQALIAFKEYKDAQELLKNAITVLNEFYSKKKESGTSLEQIDQPDIGGTPPPTWAEGTYQGAVDAAGGIIGILEVAISDFAKLESETTTQEDTAQREYDELSNENKLRKAVASKDSEYKRTTVVKLESTLQ